MHRIIISKDRKQWKFEIPLPIYVYSEVPITRPTMGLVESGLTNSLINEIH